MDPLRNQTFFSLAELNAAPKEAVPAINDRAFQKKEGTAGQASSLA